MPAVPARFNSITTGMKRNIETKPIAKESEEKDTFDPDMYAIKPNEAPKNTKTMSNNIFTESSSAVINFNNCKINSPLVSCNLLDNLEKPIVTKKRKFETIVKNFEPMEPQPSTSNSNYFHQMEKAPTKTTNETKKQNSSSENNCQNGEKKSPTERKREIGKFYLKTVIFWLFEYYH